MGIDSSEGSTFDFECFSSAQDIFGTSDDGKCHRIEFQVALKALNEKVVMICCFSLPLLDAYSAVAQAVLLASSELRVLGSCFQLVLLVDVSSCKESEQLRVFCDFLSKFPSLCLAVLCRDRFAISQLLNISPPSVPTGLLVNRSQIIMWHKPLDFFLEYGADVFPFTPDRLYNVTELEKFYKLEKACSLDFVFCVDPLPSPRLTTSLCKNPGGGQESTRIFDLESTSKRLGLYLCQTGSLIPTLDKTHKQCLAQGLELEIILVYMPFKDFENPQLFQNRINSILQNQNISWWVLPFVNWVSRRLGRLCHKDADDRLIIIDPKSMFVEPHGETVIRHFGMSGYPFSMNRLLNRELERLRTVTLKSLLAHKSRDTLLRKGSSHTCQVPLSSLERKNVLLYLHYDWDHSDNFFECFINYCQKKADDPNFEVIFVELGKSFSPSFGSSRARPWLVCRLDRHDRHYVARKIFREGSKCSTLVAFGKDGQICSLRPQELVCSSCPGFPFNDNLHNESSAVCGLSKSDVTRLVQSENTLKALLPLLGKEYFFPDLPPGARIKPPPLLDVDNSYDEDERDRHLSSSIDFDSTFVGEVAQSANESDFQIPKIDTVNFDVVSFLSTDKRPYLYRNDMVNSKLHVERLGVKKWVMVCCFFCPVYSISSCSKGCRAVSNVCSELYDHFGDSFEMVLVFRMRRDFQVDESAFRHMLSGFPSSCLVVPFWDAHARDYICSYLGCSLFSRGILLDVNERKVVWHGGLDFFRDYGVDTFPFTEEACKRTSIDLYGELWNRLSLEDLFCSKPTTVLHRNSSGGANSFDTTTIKELQGKLVGVYMCLNGGYIPMLRELYEGCKAINMAFEIVVMYFPFNTTISDPKVFQKQINRALERRNISWWVLPFRSWVSLRLKRLCKMPYEEKLIIVGQGYVDPDGEYFIHQLIDSCRSGDASGKKEVIDEFACKYYKPLNVALRTKQEPVPGVIYQRPLVPDCQGYRDDNLSHELV